MVEGEKGVNVFLLPEQFEPVAEHRRETEIITPSVGGSTPFLSRTHFWDNTGNT